jgi:hypothetical protein
MKAAEGRLKFWFGGNNHIRSLKMTKKLENITKTTTQDLEIN